MPAGLYTGADSRRAWYELPRCHSPVCSVPKAKTLGLGRPKRFLTWAKVYIATKNSYCSSAACDTVIAAKLFRELTSCHRNSALQQARLIQSRKQVWRRNSSNLSQSGAGHTGRHSFVFLKTTAAEMSVIKFRSLNAYPTSVTNLSPAT
jgi:hypothetical protein